MNMVLKKYDIFALYRSRLRLRNNLRYFTVLFLSISVSWFVVKSGFAYSDSPESNTNTRRYFATLVIVTAFFQYLRQFQYDKV